MVTARVLIAVCSLAMTLLGCTAEEDHPTPDAGLPLCAEVCGDAGWHEDDLGWSCDVVSARIECDPGDEVGQ